MAGLNDILTEISSLPSPFDFARRRYLHELHNITGRNVIAYYSAFLTKQKCENIDINDSDMTGFMNAVQGLDTSLGLDLILHTPGGMPTATESIVKYLRCKFNNDIRIVVPHMAMSAGTMMACAGKEIIMGKHSSLGPIDPQFNGIPAFDIKKLYTDASADLQSNPGNKEYWRLQLESLPPAFVYTAIAAISLSTTLVSDWLGTCMFDKNRDAQTIANIADKLNEHEDSMVHNRHYDISICRAIGLKVKALEDDQALQNAILSVHHSYMLTLSETQTIKIIENQCGKALVSQKVAGRP